MISLLEIRTPLRFAAERAYIVSVVLQEFLGLTFTLRQEERCDVHLTLRGHDGALVLPDSLLSGPGDDWCTLDNLPQEPLRRWDAAADLPGALADEAPVPVLFGEPPDGCGWFAADGETARLGLDVFGSALYMLTRAEEVLGEAGDRHGRFPSSASLAHREGFLDRPLVNEYVEILWAAIQRVWPGLERRRRSYRLLLSHDVDIPLWSRVTTVPGALRTMAYDLVKRNDAGLAARRVSAYMGSFWGDFRHDPYNTFGWIMGHSERHGLAEAFYFMTARSDPRYDRGYLLDDPWMSRLLRTIHDRGHEIGLHPSYGTFGRPDLVASELETLRTTVAALDIEQEAVGGRQHYLRWEAPDSWQTWDDVGLAYDSSVGFADALGFRAGTCYPFPVFNLRTRRALKLVERPLVAMEATALSDAYLHLSHEDALEAMASLSRRCRHFGGDFTLLWHNSFLLTRKDRELYAAVLEAAA